MRSFPPVAILGVLIFLLTAAGCSSFSGSSRAPSAAKTQPAQTQPSPASAAKKRAEQMAAALAKSQANSPGPRRIRWNQRPAPATQPAKPKRAPATQPAKTKPAPTTQPIVRKPPRLSVQQLLHQLTDRIAKSDQSASQKAVTALGLSFASPDWQMSQRLLAGLSDSQLKQIEKLHQLTALFARQIQHGTADISRDAIAAQLNQIFGQQPISIHTLKLCKSVSGFGVYDPFAHHTFLAGTDHKMIVYVELRHFRAVKQADGRYKVQLKQQIFLFDRSDGLLVWQHKPVQIVDKSRDLRHDFFVVQLIDLPANLSVGKYRLKVRITDEQGNSLDEKTTDLQIVADKSLLNSNSQDNGGG